MNQETHSQKMSQVLAKCWSDAAFKSRLMADPVAALQALGIDVPASLQLRVLEDTESVQHLVIPCPPADLSDAQLDAIAAGHSVNGKIVDSVAWSNAKHSGDAPAQARNHIYWTSLPWLR